MRRFVHSLMAVAVVGVLDPIAAAQSPPPRQLIAQSGIAPPPVSLQTGTATTPAASPAAEPGERVYPISLGAALKLAGGRPLDVQIADQQVTIAAKQLDRAKLLWVPNLVTGFDYFRHEGGQQNFAGDIVRSSRGSYAVGVGPNAVVSLADAIYSPLAAKQDLRARNAIRNAVQNDTTLAVMEAYFNVQQARGELAGSLVALSKAEEVATKAEQLAQGLAPPLEASRARVELARRQQAASTARERWRVASADLVRLLRLEPGTLVEPIEPPFLAVTVIDPNCTPDALIPIALTSRPELAGQQAVVQATLARLKQEKMRPLIPSLALRSTATNPSGSIGYGGFGGGPNDKNQGFGSRFDIDFQVLWEFQSLGFGNAARVGERRAEHQTATLDLFRTQDRIAAEVTTAFAQAKAASERMTQAEPALKEAVELVDKSLRGMGQTKRVGDTNVLIVRPLEVVTAVQAFGQANGDLYSAVADYNRAQFRLYRALGHPTEQLAGAVEPNAPSPAVGPAITPTAATEPKRHSVSAPTYWLASAVEPKATAPVRVHPTAPPITQTAYSQRTRPLPAPKPLDRDEPRKLPHLIAESVPTGRVSLMDLPVTRALLTRPADVVSAVATATAERPRPADPEIVWTAAAAPKQDPAPPPPDTSASAPLPEIPTLPIPTPPPAEQPIDWNSAKDKK